MPALTRSRPRTSRWVVACSDESGFMLIVALSILAVITILIATVAMAASDAGNTSSSVSLRERALAAADAGLRTALFRLNNTGSTAAATGSLANGTTYSYAITTLASATDPCAGLWVQSSGQTLQQACITSTGITGGLSIRTQDRVVGYAPATPALSSVSGILALNGFTVGQNFNATGDIASNGPMSFGGGPPTVHGDIAYYPTNPPPSGSSFCTTANGCTLAPQSSPTPAPSPAAAAGSAYAAAATSNNDATIPWSTDGMSYNAATGVLSSSNNATAILPSGTYYFCAITFTGTNSDTLQATIVNGQPVIIYVDSPSRPGSTCASGTGNVTAKNTLTLSNPSGLPPDFQVYVYGSPPCTTACTNTISVNNLNLTNVELYSPSSGINVKNNLTASGQLVTSTFTTGNNSTFTYGGSAGGAGNGTNLTVYYPSAHQICQAGGTSNPC